MGELAYTVKYFADNGIPLDRPWGQVQFDTRNGERDPDPWRLGRLGRVQRDHARRR